MRDEPLERIGAAREERERGAQLPRRVVEGAAQRHLLVVDAVRVDRRREPRAAGRRTRAPCRPGARARARSPRPRPCRRPRSRRPRPRPVAGVAPNERRERAPLRAGADADGPAAGVGDARAEHQPDRAERRRSATVSPALHAGALDAVEAAGERLDHRGDLGREPGRDGEEVRRGRSARARAATRRRRRSGAGSRCSQSVSWPRAHAAHAPHGAELAATTRRPVATSMPQNSWPKGLGGGPSSTGWPRRYAFRSVPSVSATSTCTSTSPVSGLGLGDVLEAEVARARGSRSALTA